MQQQTFQREAHFFDRGCQYYIAGRFAVGAALNPVAANLLHHAIEFLLQGVLARTHTLGQLREYLHKLPPLWNEFKTTVGDTKLGRFNAAIEALHTYEDLRYPDKALKDGMASTISSHRLKLPPEMAARLAGLPPVQEYSLCLQDIDELVEAIFAAANNPRFYFDQMNPKAKEVLRDGNLAAGLLK
jgi:hypothetical protein